jgi:Taurine catabolism dioxygenase TauD, TfdA family.
MGCENNSKFGGESVVVNILEIFNFLKRNKKDHFKNLNDFFYFEKRGFKKNNKSLIIRKKIFENKKGVLKFRYLKDYILSGYEIKNKKIEKKKYLALNYLDKLMSSKKYLETFKLGNGDVIIINNYKTAHGRKRFSINKSSNRSILRAWIN